MIAKLLSCLPTVVVQKPINGMFMSVALPDHLHWLLHSKRGRDVIPMSYGPGLMWDLGSNIGYYSVYAAKRGWNVKAFDISPIFRSKMRPISSYRHRTGSPRTSLWSVARSTTSSGNAAGI